MSWGIKIAVLYLAFVGMIVTMVFLCMGQTVDLESKDYYAKELAFQDKIDAIANETALEKSIIYEIKSEGVLLTAPVQFLNQDLSGEIIFYRASDASLDLKFPFQFNNDGQQIIDKAALKVGVYKMQLSWKLNNKNYFKEAVLNIKK